MGREAAPKIYPNRAAKRPPRYTQMGPRSAPLKNTQVEPPSDPQELPDWGREKSSSRSDSGSGSYLGVSWAYFLGVFLGVFSSRPYLGISWGPLRGPTWVYLRDRFAWGPPLGFILGAASLRDRHLGLSWGPLRLGTATWVYLGGRFAAKFG